MRTQEIEQQPYTDDVPVSVQMLAGQVRQSLIQIQQIAALNSSDATIQSIAETTLHLVDCYSLVKPAGQLNLELEPVSMGSVIQDVLHQLAPFAREHDCAIRDSYSGASRLVLANRSLARAALLAMGHAFIEGASEDDGAKRTILFGARTSKRGQTVGVYSKDTTITAKDLRSSQKIAGKALQQCSGLVGSGGGILLADTLLRQMNSRLDSSSYRRLPGVAALFQQNKQLQLIG